MGTMLLYGRQRIGKSELAMQLLNECNCKYIYYRYIFRNSQRKIMDEAIFFDKYIAKGFEENYVPH